MVGLAMELDFYWHSVTLYYSVLGQEVTAFGVRLLFLSLDCRTQLNRCCYYLRHMCKGYKIGFVGLS